MRDINKRMARGAMWMGLLRMSVRGLSLISTVILARLLVPADFGLVAMATAVVAFLELATAFSFDIPLIQNQDAESKHFDTAWTLNLFFFAGLSLVLVALALPAAAFYQEPRVTAVLYVLAIGFFTRGFENIGVVYFRKQLDFGKDFLVLFSKKLGGFIVTIPLAFYFRSYWALVFGIVAGNVLGVIITYVVHPYRPRLSLAAAGEMLNFSKWLVLNNAITFLRTRSPHFLIGRIAGSSVLGLFTVAFDISTLPTTELVAPINRVVFPGYAKLSNNLKALGESYLDVLALIAFIALPAGFGIGAIAEPAVDLALGAKWAGAVPIVQLLSIYGAVNALQANSGSVYNAIGKPYMITMLGTWNIVILLASSITLALRDGAIGVAIAYLATSSLFSPLTFYFVGRELGLRLSTFAAVLWRPLIGSLLMYAGIVYLNQNLTIPSIAKLAILVPAGAALYAGATLGLWALNGKPRTVEIRLAKLAINKLRARRNATPSPSI